MKFSKVLVAGLMMAGMAAQAQAAALPVVNPVSIEINGQTFTPTGNVFPTIKVTSSSLSVGISNSVELV